MPRIVTNDIVSLTEIERRRFFQKIKKTDGCWLWTGSKTEWGYGRVWLNRKFYQANRVSFAIHKHPVPKNKLVCHSCDNPSCVNPDHLFVGSDNDNWQDCRQKRRNRHPRGEEHGRVRLTTEQVMEIKRDYAPRKMPKRVFAEKFGVSVSCIQHIVRGDNWKSMAPTMDDPMF